MLKANKGDPDEIKKKWEELSEELNQFGSGPKKIAKEWQTTFANWKNQVRHKARLIKMHISQTGGGAQCDKKLSDIEERALSCWGRVPVDGSGIGDIGIGTIISEDIVEGIETAGSVSPTSPVSVTSSVHVPVTPHRNPVSQEPTTSKSVRSKAALPKLKQATTLIDAFEKHEKLYIDALNNLANGIEKLSASIEDTNNTFF